ncbi:hypothetical protein, partial [Geodermatophilus arenarius]
FPLAPPAPAVAPQAPAPAVEDPAPVAAAPVEAAATEPAGGGWATPALAAGGVAGLGGTVLATRRVLPRLRRG